MTVQGDTAPLVTITDVHPERTYSLDELNEWMLEPPAPEPPRAPRRTPLETPPSGDRPGDLFNQANTPEDVLLDAGWTHHHTDPNGEKHYTRPGKDTRDGSSATVYPDGHACIWTDATELEPRRWYDAFGLYAAIHHGGSHIAATAHIRSLGYGTPPRTPATASTPAAGSDDNEATGLEAFYVNWPDMWSREPAGEDWLVRPFIAKGRGHALYAGAKTGKSWVTLEVAAALATGRPVMHQPAGDPINVLYVDYEMTLDDLRDRLETFGYHADIDLSHLHYALLPSIPPLDTIDGGNIIHQAATACGAELVVIDTTARAVAGEENDSNVYRAFYRHTGAALKAAGIAWLRLDHAGKDATKGQRGSSAKNDDVDLVWRLERRENDAIRFIATHKRIPWAPDQFDMTKQDTDDGEIHVATGPSYPTGTLNVVVPFLDAQNVPLTAGRPMIRKLMREHGVVASNEAVRAAITYRRERAETSPLEPSKGGEKLTGSGSGQRETVNDTRSSRSPVTNKGRSASVSGSDVRGQECVTHVVVTPLTTVADTNQPTPAEDDGDLF